MDAITVVDDVDGLLLSVEDKGFDWNCDYVADVRELQKSVGVHSGRDREVFVFYIDFGLHGASLEVDVAGEADDLAGERTAGSIDTHLQRVAQVNVLHIVFRDWDAQAQQIALRDADNRKVLAIGVCAALDEGTGIGVTPDDDAVEWRRDIGVIVEGLNTLVF